MKIALDVDGVLADVIMSWLNYSNSIRPEIAKHQITSWEFWNEFKIDRYDFYTELSSCWKNWMTIPTTEKNLSSITKSLTDIGQVDIVTARERSTDSFVKSWLDHHNIEYDNYVSVIDGPMKADLDYDVFIDDSPLNAEQFLKNNKKVILYSQPWNQHVLENKIHRVSNLLEAIEKIKCN
jgi:5'(3')-deoxyribonucleotidase